jgi:hypothetical protein
MGSSGGLGEVQSRGIDIPENMLWEAGDLDEKIKG